MNKSLLSLAYNCLKGKWRVAPESKAQSLANGGKVYMVESDKNILYFWNSSNSKSFDISTALEYLAENVESGTLSGSVSLNFLEIMFEVEEKDEEVDLFEYYDTLPKEVNDLIDNFEGSKKTYKKCKQFVADLEKIGYTCEYDLDAEPYGLRKL